MKGGVREGGLYITSIVVHVVGKPSLEWKTYKTRQITRIIKRKIEKKNNSLRQRKKVSVSSARCGLGNLLWSRSRNFRHLRTWNPGRGSDLGAAIRGRRCRRHNRRLVDNFGGVQVISGAYTRTGGDQVDGSWHTHSGRN